MKRQTKFSQTFAIIAVGVTLLALSSPALAQGEDTERRFWPPNLRPAAPATDPARKRKQTTQPTYRRTSAALPKENAAAGDAVLGVTLWLLTESRQAPNGARILMPKTGRKSDYTAKTVEASMRFALGQKLRLGIEAPRNGYLYVIDREHYADGSFGEPQLIYPLNSAQDNRTIKGRVFEIPTVGDDPCLCFEVTPLEAGKPALAGDLLTILVTPARLKGLPALVQDNNLPIRLTRAQVEQWEQQWGAPAEQAEMEGGAGRLYTTREQQAGNKQGRLTQADAPPQTIFRIDAKPGQPLLAKLPLHYQH